MKSAPKLRANCEQAPVIIAVATHIDPNGKITPLDEICATACAVQNILLSAHQRGLGSFWSSAPAGCSPEFLTWLGLASTHQPLGLLFLGYPKPAPIPISTRSPLTDFITFHGATA